MTLSRLTPLLALPLLACGAPEREAAAPAAPAPAVQPSLTAATINGAAFQAPAPDVTTPQPAVIRAQAMLDRAHFSPGVIDGLGGENTRQAIAAFEKANDLPVDGQLDPQVFQRLAERDAAPAVATYLLTAEDVAGPFVGPIPDDLEAKAKLPELGYADAREALAEKFHMDADLLTALNPGVDFTRAGTRILVAAVADRPLPADVTRIEVNKAERAVRVYGPDDVLLAFYPATIGSSDNPAPSGNLTVRAVAPEPTYTYDPSRLTYGEGGEKVVVPAGPNSPVGSVWIDLSRDTYGIHGSDEPSTIGKAFSHGCVRLTNWNAEQLAAQVKPGVPVRFV